MTFENVIIHMENHLGFDINWSWFEISAWNFWWFEENPFSEYVYIDVMILYRPKGIV